MPTKDLPRPPRLFQPQLPRRRAHLPALHKSPLKRPIIADATHDFLVPNPRPDLTFDPPTLRMLTTR